MNPELKTEWVAALRSGKYVQGMGQLLCEDGAMCCLGVLCDVIGLKKAVDNDCFIAYDSHGAPLFARHYLPQALDVDTGVDGEKQSLLSDLNDDKGWSFEEIAAWIEGNL